MGMDCQSYLYHTMLKHNVSAITIRRLGTVVQAKGICFPARQENQAAINWNAYTHVIRLYGFAGSGAPHKYEVRSVKLM